MATPAVRHISECFIKPKHDSEESKEPYYLTPWDLAMLSSNYIQKGLLFTRPAAVDDPQIFLDRLKDSLALALVHFYPLAGRLAAKREENPPSYLVFVDCNNSPGAKFIHAAADMTVSDIVSPIHVPSVVQSFFDHDKVVNHDAHTSSLSLLSIQVTELVDGIFIGCSANHCMVDGTSFWHFLNMWSEIFNAPVKNTPISRPPILKRWFPDGCCPIMSLPFTNHDQFITRFEAPVLTERIFHFSAESIAKLKAKANAECNSNTISSFQALCAFVWRSVSQARDFAHEQKTTCGLAVNNRSRLDPPLSDDYFGNSIQVVYGTATAGELLEHNFGWAAQLLHEAVVSHTDKAVRGWLESWFQSPIIYHLDQFFNPNNVMIGSSPRFDKYGNEFGLGKALTLRSGRAHKFDGTVSSYPGREGGGSIDLEVCLKPNSMNALESNQEFMEVASIPL